MSENCKFQVKASELMQLMELVPGDNQTDALEQLLIKHDNLEGLCQKLHVNVHSGISSLDENDLNQRRIVYGCNKIPARANKSFVRHMLDAANDTTLIILIISAVLSLALTLTPGLKQEREVDHMNGGELELEWIEGAAILFTVACIVLVTAYNSWRKERQFSELSSTIDSKRRADVWRDGKICQLSVYDLVVGDVCEIVTGQQIPADGILLESNDLKVDESSFTGESEWVEKEESGNRRLWSGTTVMEGTGKMIVLAVGVYSQIGIIMMLLNGKSRIKRADKNESIETGRGSSTEDLNSSNAEQSIVQTKITRLIILAGYIGITISALTVLILTLRFYLAEYHKFQDRIWWPIEDFSRVFATIVRFCITGITILVVAVPEGLPLAVTISFCYGVRMLQNNNNLVRHLNACETMAHTTTICSDKTGTLTTGRMTVTQCFLNDEHLILDNNNKTEQVNSTISNDLKNLIVEAIALNTSYTSEYESKDQISGNQTECGLLEFVVETLRGDYSKIREKNPTKSLTHVYTFNSKRKLMGSVVKLADLNKYRIYCKGAAEILVKKSKFVMLNNGLIRQIDDDDSISACIDKMAHNGLRTVCIAYKDFDLDTSFDFANREAELIQDLTVLCICGLQDPVRAEVPDAIRKCQRAGIVVRMVTGDNLNTARSIAQSCGIVHPDDSVCLVLDSKEFNMRIRTETGRICQERFDQVWPNLKVLARSTPMDKYILVKHIKLSKVAKSRQVVAVTGDGTNDAPALRQADVGFAMGIQGTDVAKQACDIILTDDNFNSIEKAVIWGRNVYDGIAKFLQFQLTVNSVSVICAFVGACTIGESPLRAVQMLWVNLIMDTLASFSLATESPSDELLDRPPYSHDMPLLSPKMLRKIISQGVYQLAVMLGLLFAGPSLLNIKSGVSDGSDELFKPSQHFTMIFNSFVLMTIFNQINARHLHHDPINVFDGFFAARFPSIVFILTLGLQILIVQFGSAAFSVRPLSLDQWAWCMVFGIGSLIWSQLTANNYVEKTNQLSCFKF